MKRYGLVGKKLGHSFSKEVHARLADYNYELIELNEIEFDSFFKEKSFNAVNVTVPYKQTVIPYLDALSNEAKRIGAVNTVINKNGFLYGYNTDYYGLKALILRLGLNLNGKKVLILGSGGTSLTAKAVCEDLGATEILTVSRKRSEKAISYDDALSSHLDTEIIINTTPVGMFPNVNASPIDVSPFKNLEGVIDAVYNPLRTKLVIDAKKRGIKAEGGLYMLVMQAVFAAEKFTLKEIKKEVGDELFNSLFSAKENVVLTGMPSSGKSTVAKLLNLDGFEILDTDEEIEKKTGKSPKEIISECGEKAFRDLESQVIFEASSKCSQIIATGGGAVLREENINALKQNGKIFFIDADLERLTATDSRPLSNTFDKLKKLYDERIEIYKGTADVTVPVFKTPIEAAEFILKNKRS